MSYTIIIVTLFVAIVVVFVVVKKSKKNHLIKEVENIKEKYPLAFAEYKSQNRVIIGSASSAELKKIASITVNEWSGKEQELANKKREEEEIRKKQEEEERRKEEIRREAERAKYRSDKDDIMKVLQDNGIQYLYHFTERENLPLIKKLGGLYSLNGILCKLEETLKNIDDKFKRLDQNKIEFCDSGVWYSWKPSASFSSMQRDYDMKLEDYVRLSFCEKHPMMYNALSDGRIVDPVILIIKIDVAALKETSYSNMNATIRRREELNIGGTLDDLKQVHFETVRQQNHFNLDDFEKPFYQAEVMVKSFVPAEYIININNPMPIQRGYSNYYRY